MKRTLVFALIIILGTATALIAGDKRILTAEVDSTSLTSVHLEAGVGDVNIAVGNGPMVIASVELRPRRGGIFSSLRAAEKQVQTAEFKSEVTGSTVVFKIKGVDEDRRFEEDWTLTVPAHLALVVELGVGDVEVSNTTGGLDLELGVGEAVVQVNGGTLDIEVGVGDVTIRGPSSAYGSVETAAGVGDVLIIADGHKITGEGFIAHSAEWQGSGDATIEAEAGVGEIRVVLE